MFVPRHFLEASNEANVPHYVAFPSRIPARLRIAQGWICGASSGYISIVPSLPPVLIAGAGPCGIGCARAFQELGFDEWVIAEANSGAGGLAASIVDPQGFTWDQGGHVVFSHYGEFDRLVEEVLGDDVIRHERSSFIRISDRWVPYPFQNNLHRLPADLAESAILGLIEAQVSLRFSKPKQPWNQTSELLSDSGGQSFESWMMSMFGVGIVEQFMRPYNEKVWAHPLADMSAGWIAERVSVVDWESAVRSLVHSTDDVGWGPNNLFAFPRSGGTGQIFVQAAELLGTKVQYETRIVQVDVSSRIVTFSNGSTLQYRDLIWTGQLDDLIAKLVDCPREVRTAAAELKHNSVTVVGMGYETPTKDDGSWFYFPEADVPFYRATNFGKYSAGNLPGGRSDRYAAYMTEIASSPWRPLDRESLVTRVDKSLRQAELVPSNAPLISAHIIEVPYAYPIPTLGRDAALRVIQPWLSAQRIFARGRFGAWRYEIGNMDHAVKMGADIARRLVLGTPEEAWIE